MRICMFALLCCLPALQGADQLCILKDIGAKHDFKQLRVPSVYLVDKEDGTQTYAQEMINGLRTLAEMTSQERVRHRKKMSYELLKELHGAIVEAGYWDHPNKKIGVAGAHYYLLNAYKRQLFDNVEEQYVHDVVDGLECMIFGRIRGEPRRESLAFGGLQEAHQIALWKRLTQEQTALLALCKKYHYGPTFLVAENNKDSS